MHIDGSFETAIHEGVRRGYTDGYLRKSIVADPLRRGNTGDNTPPPSRCIWWTARAAASRWPPRAFGSENMSRIQMLKPADPGVEGFKKFVVETVKLPVPTPARTIVLGIGVGGSLIWWRIWPKRPCCARWMYPTPTPYYAQLEQELLTAVNELGIGPQGFGGPDHLPGPCH